MKVSSDLARDRLEARRLSSLETAGDARLKTIKVITIEVIIGSVAKGPN